MTNEMLEQAGLTFEEGDLRYELVKVLTTHWLTGTGCVHHPDGSGTNTAACWCGWTGPVSKNVGTAVAHHHAAEQLAELVGVLEHAENGAARGVVDGRHPTFPSRTAAWR